MRTKLLYAIVLTTTLLFFAAAPAFAQGNSGASDKTTREERMAALHEARNESMRMFRENRTAAFEAYHTAFNATKASFLENKTRVKDECAALRNSTSAASNDTATENKTTAADHCVRDGMKPLIEKAKAEHKEQKTTLRESLMKAREDAKSHFQAKRAHAPARSG